MRSCSSFTIVCMSSCAVGDSLRQFTEFGADFFDPAGTCIDEILTHSREFSALWKPERQ